jgi:hypothetical protein
VAGERPAADAAVPDADGCPPDATAPESERRAMAPEPSTNGEARGGGEPVREHMVPVRGPRRGPTGEPFPERPRPEADAGPRTDFAEAPRPAAPHPPMRAASRSGEPRPDAAAQVDRFLRLEALRPAPARDGGEMRLEVAPEGLGRVEVRVVVRDDAVHATLTAEHGQARETLAANRPALEQALGRAQLRLEGFDVGLGHGAPRHALPDEPAPSRLVGARPASAPSTEPVPAAPAPVRRGVLSLRA